MSDDTDFQTSPTLLARLQSQSDDHSAWLRFEERYSPMISAWCRRWGVQSSDADDLCQDVLMALCKQMSSFEYDASLSFRGFLRTIARRAWCDLLSQRNRQAVATGETAVLELIQSQGDGDEFAEQLEAEWRKELLEQAMQRVRQRVKPHTWQAFELLTRDGRSGAEVAATLDMKIGAVWVAKSKIKKMLQDEVAALEAAERLPPIDP
ncbi:MAG: RNA polymerase sigma factor [Planctomycetota bacterium]